jgi:Uma2 family endonuclease
MPKIKVPEGKPAFEWVNGRILQKASPGRRHALAQATFSTALSSWTYSTGAGVAGLEWRFHVRPPGDVRRPLVPDVAFLSYKRLPYPAMLQTDEPSVAPDVVVEINSPSDRRADIEEKVRVYLAAGTDVVFLVDPKVRAVTVCDRKGRRHLNEGDEITHSALPDFRLNVSTLFELPKPK